VTAAAANARAAAALAAGLHPGAALHVVLSPGSRSTPLALAFDALPDTHVHVVVDERAAAFLALGISRRLGRPAILVCTSGSAPGHYLPALMEADQARVPLIAVSADRPAELHHVGAPQTIVQAGMFGAYVRWAATLPTPDGAVPSRWFTAIGRRARAAALGSPPGPVHLDAPFREPFGAAAAPERAAARLVRGSLELDAVAADDLACELARVERGVVVCGPAQPATVDQGGLARAAAELAARLGWPLVADVASGARFGGRHERVRFGDALARAGALPPAELALRIGALPTSKALNAWLEGAARTVLVDPDGWQADPASAADTLVVAEPARLCRQLASALAPRSRPSAWQARWRGLDRAAAAALAAALEEAPCDSALAARALAGALPAGTPLHVASSSPIRDLDSFVAGAEALAVSCNRGVNGIDGSVATATGVALAAGRRVVALVGDLALVHDFGGLLAACAAGAAVTVVVNNNDGGGIFEGLPIAGAIERERFERLFATPQGHAFGPLCRAAGARHLRTTAAELGAALAAELGAAELGAAELGAAGGVGVIEVAIDRQRDAALRRELWARVTRALTPDQLGTFQLATDPLATEHSP
jgi:2-succinyl-5-enolpyruvyl-6-hydroxy-3-cyclohexene-1-carboxylate synthase